MDILINDNIFFHWWANDLCWFIFIVGWILEPWVHPGAHGASHVGSSEHVYDELVGRPKLERGACTKEVRLVHDCPCPLKVEKRNYELKYDCGGCCMHNTKASDLATMCKWGISDGWKNGKHNGKNERMKWIKGIVCMTQTQPSVQRQPAQHSDRLMSWARRMVRASCVIGESGDMAVRNKCEIWKENMCTCTTRRMPVRR